MTVSVIFKAAYSDVDRRLKKSEDRFELLKSHAESKLQEANETIANLQRRNESELAKMHAMIRQVFHKQAWEVQKYKGGQKSGP